MFTMYHSTPMSRYTAIMKQGLTPRMSPHAHGLWSPKVPIIYLTDSVAIARDYANQAYAMRKTDARAWAIFEVTYDEFPNEVHVDLEWGLPGTYYVTIRIPPEHLRMVEQYFVMGVIRKKGGIQL